jgi:hypothetical protein
MNNPQQKLQNSKQVRKTYLKPQVVEVCLIPGEAILGGCKSASINGQGNAFGCQVPMACITNDGI